MNMIFSHPTLNDINIHFNQFTQIIGHNQQVKHYIWQLLSWYFGGKKYSEDDLSIFDQQEPQIFNEDTLIKRNEYKVLTLSSLEDIVNQMTYKKGTIAFEFVKDNLNVVDIMKEVEEINGKLEHIASVVNRQINYQINQINYEMKSVDFTIEQLLLKSFVPRLKFDDKVIAFELINNIDKILLIINMLKYNLSKTTDKLILVMKNMDDYLTHDEFIYCCQLFDDLCNQFSHFNIIIFPSNEGYLYLTEKNIADVNIISDMIVNYYDFDFMYQRFSMNYPNNRIPTENDFLLLLQKNSNYLFTTNLEYISLSAEDLVAIKILNHLYQYDKKLSINYKVPDTLTINFLRENFDIKE